MRQQQLAIFSFIALFSLAGCGTDERGRPCAQNARSESRPARVVGVLAPREGLTIPAGTSIEIVVRRGDDSDQVLAVHPLGEVRSWPVRFEVPMKWPNVPDDGEDVAWKASPPVLSVFARGAVAGKPAFISESRPYTVEDSVSGRPTNLALVPVRE